MFFHESLNLKIPVTINNCSFFNAFVELLFVQPSPTVDLEYFESYTRSIFYYAIQTQIVLRNFFYQSNYIRVKPFK